MIKTDTKSWHNVFDKQIETTIKANNKIQVEASKELLNRIENRTPIGDPSLWNWPAHAGYVPGTLRASWTLSYGVKGKDVYINISNDQPYAERVEFGYSTQAPEGMMRLSCLEWSDIINDVAKRYKI